MTVRLFFTTVLHIKIRMTQYRCAECLLLPRYAMWS